VIGAALNVLPQKLLAEIVGVIVEIALVAGVACHYTAKHYEAKEEAAHAAQLASDLAASQRNRALESQLAQARQEASDAKDHALQQVATVTAAFHVDADGVRHALAAALDGSRAGQDSLAACQQRAATAGNLLADGLRVQADLAGAAESHAAEVRSMRGFDTTVHQLMNPIEAH
jgi:hypothetical protein